MKNTVKFISILLCAVFALSAFAYAEEASGAVPEEQSVLNISGISEEQAQLCAAVMLDGFEADETERSVSDGTLASVSVSALEGEKCMLLTGNGKAELTLTLTKKRTTANTRSLCVCAYVEPAEDASFDMTVTVYGAEKTVTGTAPFPSGQWVAAYLPIDTNTTVNIQSIKVKISSKGESTVRVSCRIDRVHTATVDGLPDKLKYFASGFTPNRAELEYTEDALIYRPTGSNSYMESTDCGYLTNGRYNALAVTIENRSDAKKVTLRLKLDRQYSYTEENTHTLAMLEGEHVYNFPIGGFRSGVSVDTLRLELPGSVSGEIAIKSISFSSYRFPAEYNGEVKAETSGDKLKVYGTLDNYPASAKRICLYRLLPGLDEEEPGDVDAEPYAEAAVSSSFSFELPVTEDGYDNTHFKYLVRYETKTGYEDAGVTYVNSSKAPAPAVPYKGAAAEEDATLLPYLAPGIVYADVDLGELFGGEGDIKFSFADQTAYISSAALAETDALTDRCAEDKIYTVLRLVYSPFANSEKYYFVADNNAWPDITTAEGAAHFMSLLSFFGQRYGKKLSAVIPCGEFDTERIAEIRMMTADKAEKYAADVVFAAQSALSASRTAVIAPVGADGAELFLSMFEKDVKEPEKIPVYIETENANEAKRLREAAVQYPFSVIFGCRVNSAAELAELYYGCAGAAGICVRGLDTADERAELFSVIDTTYGVTAANRLAADAFPDGVEAVYGEITKPEKQYDYQGTLYPAELPQMLTTVCDGADISDWRGFDCCKSVYTAAVNGEEAAGLAFDFTSGGYGYAAFYPQTRRTYGTVYLRLYADYLPEDAENVEIRITAESDKGAAAGVCTLEAETMTVIPMKLDSAGRIKRFTFAPVGIQSGQTPRICVLGIYTAEKDSFDTITEAQTETMPEPETQVFDTGEVTTAESGDRGDARLYLIAILVIIGMFALCGVVIIILKKRDRDKTDTPS